MIAQQNSNQKLQGLLACVECAAELDESALVCGQCSREYTQYNGAPVLLRQDNALFPPHSYEEQGGGRSAKLTPGFKARLKSMVPGRSINLVRGANLGRIAKEYGAKDGARILIIGCGAQKEEIEAYFATTSVSLIFCDIDKAATADLFCDSHQLPFRDGQLAGVISTAVLEHVLKPWVVAEEIHRVLAADGFVYSEVPFLQAVHEGPYDFTRFTLGGHRLLYEKFDEMDSGVVAGPGTALNWAVVEYARALSSNRKLASVLRMAAQTCFFWLKHTDRILGQSRRAQESASCTYFYGTRRETAVSPLDIIDRYGATEFSHT